MRFEPPEFIDPQQESPKETPLFRMPFSLNPIVLNLLFCALFFSGYRIASPLVYGDLQTIVLRFVLAGWFLALLFFALSVWTFLYNRIEVTDRRIYGRKLSLLHGHLDVPLTDISSVRVSQHVFGSLLHYGRITLYCGKKRLFLIHVKEPMEVKKALDRELAKATPSVP